ncbi:hypothetical protein GBO77_04950 [Pediococcus acidilactici]|nr:hypothetical protein GBO77_04950 [Pediococcus acidilactici]
MVNTILKEADLFCPNSVRINFTIYLKYKLLFKTGLTRIYLRNSKNTYNSSTRLNHVLPLKVENNPR